MRAHWAASGLLAVMMWACGDGDDDRPPVADELPERATQLLAPAPAPEPKPWCTPGSSRPCLLVSFTEGRKNCYPALQYCRADGFGWLGCGTPAQVPLATEDADDDQDDDDPVEADPTVIVH